MLELIIAVFIILTALGGIATMVTMSVRGQERSEESVIAYNLAREGIEVARALRDNTFTTGILSTNCNSFCTTFRSNIQDHNGIIQMDPASNTNPFGFVLNYSGSGASFIALGNRICQRSGGGPIYQRSAGTGCLTGDTLTRFRRRLVVDYICLDPSTNEECVETGKPSLPATCTVGGTNKVCTANYSQLAGHRVQSRVQVTNRKGGDLEVVSLEDYLYAWK